MIALVLALGAAAANALSSVLQRRAARDEPDEQSFHLGLLLDLLRRPAWLGGIAALIAGFVLQASALDRAPLALVQPVLVTELPFTLLLARPLLNLPWERRAAAAAVLIGAGLAALLVGMSPSGGGPEPGGTRWLLGAGATAGLVVVLVLVALRCRGSARAALLGTAAGTGFALTAAFMKSAVGQLSGGLGAVFTGWPVYAMVAAGIASLFLLQNAFQAGSIVAAQPAVTVSDPVVSTVLGALVLGEQVRGGLWIVLEVVGVAAIVLGTVELSRSPLVTGAGADADQGGAGGDDGPRAEDVDVRDHPGPADVDDSSTGTHRVERPG